jgi:hypothetical protein
VLREWSHCVFLPAGEKAIRRRRIVALVEQSATFIRRLMVDRTTISGRFRQPPG